MRRRLLVSTLGVALVAVLLLGIPLGVVATKLIRDEAQKRMNREAAQIATALDSRAASGTLTTAELSRFTADDRQVYVRSPKFGEVVAGDEISGPLQKGVATGSSDDVVTVYASDSDIDRQIVTVWFVVVGLAVIALGAAVWLARRQARNLGGPLEDLADVADRLGSGDPRPHSRRYGIAEFDRVSAVLDRSAERIAQLLRGERELAANASHQLRTPLTALSIRLEEIHDTTNDPHVREEAAAALTQAERLVDVVESLLENARTSRAASAVLIDVDEVLEQQRLEWEPAFRRSGRRLRIEGRRGLKAVGTPGGLAQAVATLIDNALTHGSGTVSLRTRHSGGHVVLEIADQGPGVADALVPRIFERSFSSSASTGLGLGLARDLVEADGGRLELVQLRPPVFTIFLLPDAEG